MDNVESKPNSTPEKAPSVTGNDRKKLIRAEKSQPIELNPSDSKNGSEHEKNRLKKRDGKKLSPEESDLVQCGTALENPKYGKGGGKQYFIPDAARKPIRDSANIPLRNGCLENTGKTDLQYNGPINRIQEPIESKAEKQRVKPKITVNDSPLSKSEKAEWKQLDKNTQDERALPKVMPEGKQSDENWRHAHSNQENRGSSINPDSWTNPRQLKNGEKFYQLRPSGENRASDYFTDARTVDKCRNKNGEVDVAKLLDALQLDPQDNKDWTLREYVYRKK